MVAKYHIMDCKRRKETRDYLKQKLPPSDWKRRRFPTHKYEHYTSLNRPKKRYLDDDKRTFSDLLCRSPPHHRQVQRWKDTSQYCLFYKDHDHDAEVCDHLKNKIEKLVKNEYNKKFLARHPKEIGQRKSQREEQVEKGPREERQSKEPNREDSLTGERLLNMVTHMITGGSSFELPTLREEKDMPRFTLAWSLKKT